jgi:hypothetical protein
MPRRQYEKFNILNDVRLVHNYLTSMADSRNDYLPYWLIGMNENPAWAKHCKVDDAELVASWYEALVCSMEMLDTSDGAKVLDGFKRHLLRSWGERGLRYSHPYPWTHTIHSSFHEMGYVLPALVRWLEREPAKAEVRERLVGLVRGMRGLVYERRTRSFWSGDHAFDMPVYEFPNDLYTKGGWDFTCVTGRGEEAIRNGIMLHSLVRTYQLFGDEVALDLARGIANHLVGMSRYFNWKGEFFGHVHSAVWVAAGLVLLGRLTGEAGYVDKGRQVFQYVLGMSSSFGWIPEYAQWHPISEEHCETCCIRDMILCGFELIDAGYEEYWDTINRFTRNQLAEQQIKTGVFVGVDNGMADTFDTAYRDIDKRIVGGYSGGAEPNSISIKRFRSVAGCCVGTAPQALYQVYKAIVTEKAGCTFVNLPIDKNDGRAEVTTGYPNEGWMKVVAGRPGDFAVRMHPFMRNPKLSVNGADKPISVRGQCAVVAGAAKGTEILLTHDLKNESRKEVVRGTEYEVIWRGSDVVKILPEGDDLRLYQRTVGIPKKYPVPPERTDGSKGFDARPTEQKK